MIRFAGEQLFEQANNNINIAIFGTIIVNVKAFGARGDGVTDDTAAIQRAINYAISIGKHEVTFPAGNYVYGVLTNTSGITFLGDGVTLNGTTPVPMTNHTPQKLLFVTYEMFREAYPNDDGAMIRAAHEYANLNNLQVSNQAGEYHIEGTRDFPVRTNTYLGQSIFHVNDKYLNEPVFRIETDQITTTLADTGGLYTTILGYLKKGATPTIPQLATYRNSMIEFVDSGHKVYARNGSTITSGEDMINLCYVNDYGKIEGEISFDFTGLTSVKVTPINQNYLDFKGGTFLMSGDSDNSIEPLLDNYREGLIRCERSRTRISEQFIGFDAGKTDTNVYDVGGLIRVEYCYDVEINTVRNVGMLGGGYGFDFYKVTKLSLQNIDANAAYVTWGIVGSNWIKDVIVHNCKLSRFDTHVQCWNLNISQSTIGTSGITLSGGGTLVVEDTTVESECFLQFRADFGASWDGDISIRGKSILRPTSDFPPDVFDSPAMKLLFFRLSDFNHKIPIVHGRNIVVEDFTFDYTNVSATFNEPCFYYSKIVGGTVTNIGTGNFYLADSIAFRRVRKNRDDITVPVTKVHIENLPLAKITKAGGTYGTGIGGDGYRCNAKIIIENCDMDDYQRLQQNNTASVVYLKGATFIYGALTPIYDILINQCLEVKLKIEGLAAYIRVLNSDVCAVDLSSDGVTTNTNILAYAIFDKCNVRIDSTSTIYGTDARTAFYLRQGTNGKFVNCHFGMPIINGANASVAQIRRVYKNSIIDFEGKLMITNMSGNTLDESLFTATSVLAQERQMIFIGCAYSSAGVSYVVYLTSIAAIPAYVGQLALVAGIWYKAIATTATTDWKALN